MIFSQLWNRAHRFSASILFLGFLIVFTASGSATAQQQFEGQTLNYITRNTPFARGIPDLLAEFEEMTGATVNVELMGVGAYWQKAGIELSSQSSAFDVFDVETAVFSQWTQAGWLTPLDEFISQTDETDAYLNLEDFLPTQMAAVTTEEGRILALPIFAATVIMYYRSDLIDTPPDTWEGVLALAQELHDPPNLAAVGLRGQAGQSMNMWIAPSILYAYGASIVEDYPGGDMHPVINSEEAVAAFDLYATLVREYGFDGMANANFSEIMTEMQQGRLALMIDGAPLAGQVLDPERSIVTDRVAFAPVPAGPAGRVAPFTTHSLGINSASNHKDLAWEFIKWVSSPQVQLRNSLENNHVAVTSQQVLSDPAYIEKYGAEYLEVVNETLSDHVMSFYRPLSPEWPEVGDRLGSALHEIITGQSTAQDALNEVNESLDVIYRRAGYY